MRVRYSCKEGNFCRRCDKQSLSGSPILGLHCSQYTCVPAAAVYRIGRPALSYAVRITAAYLAVHRRPNNLRWAVCSGILRILFRSGFLIWRTHTLFRTFAFSAAADTGIVDRVGEGRVSSMRHLDEHERGAEAVEELDVVGIEGGKEDPEQTAAVTRHHLAVVLHAQV